MVLDATNESDETVEHHLHPFLEQIDPYQTTDLACSRSLQLVGIPPAADNDQTPREADPETTCERFHGLHFLHDTRQDKAFPGVLPHVRFV